MKTCLQNCRPGDKIVWSGIDRYTGTLDIRTFTVVTPFQNRYLVAEPDHKLLFDECSVHFYKKDLYPSPSGYLITKIIKATA